MIVQIQVAYDITVENIYYWPLLYTVHFSITYNSNQYRDKVLSNSMQTSPAIHTCMCSFIQKDMKIPNGCRKAWEALGSKPENWGPWQGQEEPPMKGGSTELKGYILWYLKEYEIFSEVRFLALKHLKVSHENIVMYTDTCHLGESPWGNKERQHEWQCWNQTRKRRDWKLTPANFASELILGCSLFLVEPN